MKGKLVGLLMAGCLAVGGCNRESDIVGSYIGGDDGARIMVQITSANDHDIRGKLVAVTTDATGKVAAIGRPLEGTVDAGEVNLNVETGTGVSLLTGKQTSEGLELTVFSGDKSEKMTFARSDPTQFTTLVDGVRRHAAQIKQAADQETAHQTRLRYLSANQDRINAFAATMSEKADRLADSIAKIDGIIPLYRSTASQAARLKGQRAQIVAMAGSDDVRADQVSYARERNSDAAASQHELVQDALKGLDTASAENESTATAIMAKCQTDSGLDCGPVISAMALYRTRVAAFREAAIREQQAYDAERPKF